MNDNVAAMSENNILIGYFGLYPSFVAGILNSVSQINFYVLCKEQLNYADYTEKSISSKGCSIPYKSHKGNYFQL